MGADAPLKYWTVSTLGDALYRYGEEVGDIHEICRPGKLLSVERSVLNSVLVEERVGKNQVRKIIATSAFVTQEEAEEHARSLIEYQIGRL